MIVGREERTLDRLSLGIYSVRLTARRPNGVVDARIRVVLGLR